MVYLEIKQTIPLSHNRVCCRIIEQCAYPALARRANSLESGRGFESLARYVATPTISEAFLIGGQRNAGSGVLIARQKPPFLRGSSPPKMAPEQVQIPDTHHHSCDWVRAAVSELPEGSMPAPRRATVRSRKGLSSAILKWLARMGAM